jgi:hypothetical protein
MTTKDPIATLIEDTEAVEREPGDFQAGDRVRDPGPPSVTMPDGVPGSVVADLLSAGHTILYDTITREPSVVNNNMLFTQLESRREDGSRAFTRIKPIEPPWRGSFKCFLHEDQPDRARYDSMGFPTCKKATMPNQYQADNHARNRHRDEWRAVEAEREIRERREDREAQQAMVNAVATQGVLIQPSAMPVDVTATDATNVRPVQDIISSPAIRSGQCQQCNWASTAPKSPSRKSALKRHIASVHA